MRLENDFYTCTRFEGREDGFSLELRLNPEHAIFRGHFPEKAVVPGVCTLSIVREQLERFLGCRMRFASIKECKFTGAVLPDECCEMAVEVTLEGDNLQAEAYSGGNKVLKLKASIEREN